MRPPLFMRIRVQEPGERNVRLWIPLILIWGLLALLLIVLSPLVVVVGLLMLLTADGRAFLQMIGASFQLLGYLHGLRVEVNNASRGSRVQIDVI